MRSVNKLLKRIPNEVKLLIIWAVYMIMIVVVLGVKDYDNRRHSVELNSQRQQLEQDIKSRDEQIDELLEQIKEQNNTIDELRDQLQKYRETSVNVPTTLSRGGTLPILHKLTMRTTVYNAEYESCGKRPGNPAYGITASGTKATPWRTIASGRDLPFGTVLYIPFFKDKPNHGIFIVEDRGGAITSGRLDIYTEWDESEMTAYGVRNIEVQILRYGK